MRGEADNWALPFLLTSVHAHHYVVDSAMLSERFAHGFLSLTQFFDDDSTITFHISPK
jgi:hypothetical protein